MAEMDDDRNTKLFRILQEDCEWKDPFHPRYPLSNPGVKVCRASGMICEQKACMPFKFSLYFNRPEIKHG